MKRESRLNQLDSPAQWLVSSPQYMADVSRYLAHHVQRGSCIYFEGELGSGKTTLIRSIFRELGIEGAIPSPTFSIMETYTTPEGLELLHLDLYRIENPKELALIGLDEFREEDWAWFIEWPGNGADVIPAADLRIRLRHAGNARIVEFPPALEVQ